MPKMQLKDLNDALERDPGGFIASAEQRYDEAISACAAKVKEHQKKSRIILLAGPSGSAKTTTALRLRAGLEARGIRAHAISLDDYYLDFSPETYPKTESGESDLESPLCLDIPLLNEQLSMLARGEEILVPRFDFKVHKRDPDCCRPLRLGPGDAVVFEGLHALNPMFTELHPDAFRLYVSPQTDLYDGETLLMRHGLTRLLRRSVRDLFHRSSPAEETLSLWANVCRGDRLFIRPYKHLAQVNIDSSLLYEWSALGCIAKPMFEHLTPGTPQQQTVTQLLTILNRLCPVSLDQVPETSLLKEEFLQ